MPCTFTGSLEGDRELAAREALDVRERMLCAVCSLFELDNGADELDAFLTTAARAAEGLEKDDITKWWKAHKAAEARHAPA
jgi:hypothetical protein